MGIIPPVICGFTSGWVQRRKPTWWRFAGLQARWDTLTDLDVNHLYVIEEGGKISKNQALSPAKKG